jgi:transposase-like protein
MFIEKTDRRSATRMDDATYLTFAAAARRLGVSETTLRKWISSKLVNVMMIGPPGHELKRIAVEEIERLKRIA